MRTWVDARLREEVLKWSDQDWTSIRDLSQARREFYARLLRLLPDDLETMAEAIEEKIVSRLRLRPDLSRQDFLASLPR
jgi:hypothetical protein